MKIGVNARLLSKAYTGIGQYTKNLFKELASLDAENEYILVVAEKVNIRFPKNVRLVVIPEKKLPGAGLRKTWWEQVALRKFFKKEKVDIAWFTYPSNFWADSWYRKGIKTVVTVHDCIPWTSRHYRTGALSKLYHSKTKRAVAKADIVFTVSGTSKEEIERICKVPEKKIHVIYNDAGDTYKNPVDSKFAAEVLERFSLKAEKYLLYVGGYDTRKNVEFLINESLSLDLYPLVLVGGKLFKGKLYKSFDEGSGEIIKTGFLEEQTIAALYSRCFAFVHLSKQEGFNIPLLEAANCGAPLIISDIAVHREVAEDKAIFVSLEKKGGLAEAIKNLETNREKYIELSRALAKRYSWKKYAKIVKDVICS